MALPNPSGPCAFPSGKYSHPPTISAFVAFWSILHNNLNDYIAYIICFVSHARGFFIYLLTFFTTLKINSYQKMKTTRIMSKLSKYFLYALKYQGRGMIINLINSCQVKIRIAPQGQDRTPQNLNPQGLYYQIQESPPLP